MTKYMQPTDKKTLDRFWLSVESFLIAVANISNILWPSHPSKCNKCNFQPELSPEISARRQDLLTVLDINNSSPINSRKFRNYLEHYDFRMEELAKKSNKLSLIQILVLSSLLLVILATQYQLDVTSIRLIWSYILEMNHTMLIKLLKPYKTYRIKQKHFIYDVNLVLRCPSFK